MSRVLNELHQDHINVARLLHELERQLRLIGSGRDTDYGRLVDIMRYMTEYPDLVHHPKEDVMFELLVRKDRAAEAAVAELEKEHRKLAEAGLHAVKLLRQIESEGFVARDEIVAALAAYVELLRGHMNKEESHIFPLVRVVLEPSDWEEIEARLQSRRDPLFGGQVEASYRALYAFISQNR